MPSSRLALAVLLLPLGSLPVVMSADDAVPSAAAVHVEGLGRVEGVGPFPGIRETNIDGRPEKLLLTGTAVRKAFGLTFYQIAGYCDCDHRPSNVDAYAAADVPKQLIFVMEKNISENILRKSFEKTFSTSDPKQQYTGAIKQLLDHLTAKPLSKGDKITLTHVPQKGIECSVCEAAPLLVDNREFAHVVWNIYVGPNGVSPDMRKGLGSRLSSNAAK